MKNKNYIDIEVTEEDIENGKIANHDGCPIALAGKRTTGNYWSIVHPTVLEYINILQPINKYKMTRKMREFYLKFDSRKHVNPTKFRLKRIAGNT